MARSPIMVFLDNDDAYEDWIREHREGYIATAEHRTAGEVRLHRSDCFHVTKRSPGAFTWTTEKKAKMYGDTRSDLEACIEELLNRSLVATCDHCQRKVLLSKRKGHQDSPGGPSGYAGRAALVRPIQL